MKKLLSFIFLLFIPFVVNAEVKISSAELVDNTEGLEAELHPEFKGLQLEFDLKFTEVDEFVKYKVVVENDTNKDYEIEAGEKIADNEYIKYTVEYEGDSILKAKTSKIVYITATYAKEVPAEEYVEGKYVVKKTSTINLVNNEEQQNPNTKVGYIILVAAIILLVSLLLAIFFKHKLAYLAVIVLTIAIPLTIYAIEKLTIQIEANIEIEEPTPKFTLAYGCLVSHSDHGVRVLPYNKGDTWEEYFNSTYFTSLEENLQNYIMDDYHASKTFSPGGNVCLENGQFTNITNNCLYDLDYTDFEYTDVIKPSREGVYYINKCK